MKADYTHYIFRSNAVNFTLDTLFHKIEELGFAAVYKEKELVHRALRRFFFLPYVPIEHVVSAFEFCAAELSRFFDFFFVLILVFLVRVGPKYRPFKDYIARTWVCKKLKGNQYSNPLYRHDKM